MPITLTAPSTDSSNVDGACSFCGYKFKKGDLPADNSAFSGDVRNIACPTYDRTVGYHFLRTV